MTTKFPTVTGAGALIPFMDANRKREIVNIVFENIGGVQRLTHEAEKDPRWFLESFWAKLLPRGTLSTDNGSAAGTVDDLIDKLDRAANAKVINGDYEEKKDAT